MCYGTGAFCYAADRDEEWNEIVGSRGRIVFSTSAPVPIRVMRGDAVEEMPIADPPHVHQPLIQTIVDEMNGTGKCPSTGVSGARTTAVIDEVLREFRARQHHPPTGGTRMIDGGLPVIIDRCRESPQPCREEPR